MAELTNCTQCQSSGLVQQFGNVTRVCRRRPPSVVVLPGDGPREIKLTSVFPTVDDTMRCDDFVLAEAAKLKVVS